MAKAKKLLVNIPAIQTRVWRHPPFVWTQVNLSKPDIKTAVKDAQARRFYNKNYTADDDFLGAVSFWVACKFPRNSLEDFLSAIEPESRWQESESYNPVNLRRRPSSSYVSDFNNLLQGYWDKWTNPPKAA